MKNSIFHRVLSLLLAVLFTAALCMSCADNSGNNSSVTTGRDETTAPLDSESEVELQPDLPDENFEGYEFKVLHWYVSGWDSRRNKDIFADSETGDPINDAVYKRNLYMTEKYNVTFSIQEELHSDVISMAQKFISADEDAYDLVYARMTDIATQLTAGYYLDLNKLEYVDFSKPWWDQNSVESLSVLGKLYLVASDVNIIDKDATAAIAFNKQYAIDNKFPDLYELVDNGTWTMDTMLNLYKGKSRDLDGNSIIDENDVYAFLGKYDVTISFFLGGGGSFVSKDENDEPQLSFESDRNYNIAEKIFEIMYDPDNFYNQHTMQKPTDDTLFEQMFANGHGIFYWMRLDNVSSMRASETEFGILPIPKYDDAQSRYYSMVSIHTSGLMTVPKTATDPSRTGFILEAWAAKSKYTVIPAYIDRALKGKHVRDDESEAMLDLIFATRTYDLGDVFGFGSLASNFTSITGTNNSDISSFYKKLEKSAQKAIEKFVTTIEKAE